MGCEASSASISSLVCFFLGGGGFFYCHDKTNETPPSHVQLLGGHLRLCSRRLPWQVFCLYPHYSCSCATLRGDARRRACDVKRIKIAKSTARASETWLYGIVAPAHFQNGLCDSALLGRATLTKTCDARHCTYPGVTRRFCDSASSPSTVEDCIECSLSRNSVGFPKTCNDCYLFDRMGA